MPQLQFFTRASIAMALPALLVACSPNSEKASQDSSAETAATSDEKGELVIRANGEDFVRQGFVTKDGWQVDFDHVFVTLTEVTAYQTDPPFDPEADESPQVSDSVTVDEPITIDLAEGDADAEPILVTTLQVPTGRYNALSWQMVPADQGPSAGQTLWLEGTATKDEETVDFVIKLDSELEFLCGDYVGDNRKGIVTASDAADLEATFHFDHLFGDGEADPADEINTGALGFEPLAAIAQGESLSVDQSALEAQLSEADYATLQGILPSLGHVGEGHCEETQLSSS